MSLTLGAKVLSKPMAYEFSVSYPRRKGKQTRKKPELTLIKQSKKDLTFKEWRSFQEEYYHASLPNSLMARTGWRSMLSLLGLVIFYHIEGQASKKGFAASLLIQAGDPVSS